VTKMRAPRYFSRRLYSAAWLCSFSLLLTVTGCFSGHLASSGTPPPGAPTVTMSANPASIAPGSSSVLTVVASNATSVSISDGAGHTDTLAATGGTQSVTPAATTTYTVTATGTGGTTTATAVVTVMANPAPTVTIAANPTSITAGSSSVLTVVASNATTVSISDGTTNYPLQATGGTQSVTPTATTTYTVTATGAGGTMTATAVVTVTANPVPTIMIAANPTSVTAGSSSILTVTATNATTVSISDGTTTYPLQATGGTQAVTPTATTTYTATAKGPGGTVTATTVVTVTPNPVPTVTITASPTSIVSGSSATLTVNTANATSVTITGGGTTYTLQSTSGTQTVSPTTTTTYTATATGPGGSTSATAVVVVTPNPPPTVTISANPSSIISGNSSTLTVTAANATTVTVTAPGGVSYSLQPTGGTESVSPTATTTYTATATGPGGSVTTATTVTVTQPGSLQSVDHIIFMLQENHSFDNYFGMLNPYRAANNTNGQVWNVGDDNVTYTVDGIDDKLTTISNPDDGSDVYKLFKFTSTCIDDESSDWLASFGDVNRYDFQTNRPINMDGFVHNAEGYAASCSQPGATCSGTFTGDTTGRRSMGYYDQTMLNYYYFMASQFAISDRWFSPVASKSISNRIATFTGGTTQGLVKDPGNDGLGQLQIPTIFHELDVAGVSWKIYYTVSQALCLDEDDCTGGSNAYYPATDFSNLGNSYKYLYENPGGTPCTAPTIGSKAAVGDPSNSFCIDPTHIALIGDANHGYYADLTNGTLPSFAFIEAGYGNNDEHPGSGQSILQGQAEVAKVVDALMTSTSWKDSIFFFSYDEGGGPYDHVPPVPSHTNDFTTTSQLPNYSTDISSIAVNPDTYYPCVPPAGSTPNYHCDLTLSDPGATTGDAAQEQGFAAQLGFRLPNIVISPFARRHYVSHIPMDHTAVIKFVENRFITGAHLTARDAAEPNLLDFFDFTNTPWATPPTPPTPVSLTDSSSPGYNSCQPANMGP
jgi:phospholipase C